jgi:hypothetical protein
LQPPEEYLALLPGRCPAYITPERHAAIQRRIAEDRARSESKGAVREGPSLLAGLVSCARCGYRMAVHYGSRGRYLRYIWLDWVLGAHGASGTVGLLGQRRRTSAPPPAAADTARLVGPAVASGTDHAQAPAGKMICQPLGGQR